MRFMLFLLVVAVSPQAHAQGGTQGARAPADMALGIAAHQALKPKEALKHFQAVLATDSMNYEANCRAALAAADIVRQSPNDKRDPNGYYTLANQYARRALAVEPDKAQSHFLVALTIGFIALGKAPENRLRTAEEIWRHANKAIALDPNHDGAYHVLGRWHAELARFSWAKPIVKAAIGRLADSASWEGAAKNMERAVELAPSFIYHRVDLAETYIAMKRPDDARLHLTKIESLPVADVRDPIFKAEAKQRLSELATGR